MKTLIVYASNRGSTETIAEKMKEELGRNVVLVNLRKSPDPSIKEYQRIIIGSSSTNHQLPKRVNSFCLKNQNELLDKEIGLFICNIEEEEVAKNQLMSLYPTELYNAAKSTAIFQSGFNFSRMNFLEKMIAQRVKGLKNNSSKLDYEAVQKFSRRMDRVFNPFLFLA